MTMCTWRRECVLGEIAGGEMRLNTWGRIVESCWVDIERDFAHAALDGFVVMPNHVHGIVVMTDDGRGTACRAPTGELGSGWRGWC